MANMPTITIPTPDYFVQNSGDRIDKADGKSRALALAAKHGSMRAAIASGDCDRMTIQRYLADGNFSENLSAIEHQLAAMLSADMLDIARFGKEENRLRAMEFILPALEPRFDAGIRRQNASNSGNLAQLLVSHALKSGDVEIELADPFPD